MAASSCREGEEGARATVRPEAHLRLRQRRRLAREAQQLRVQLQLGAAKLLRQALAGKGESSIDQAALLPRPRPAQTAPRASLATLGDAGGGLSAWKEWESAKVTLGSRDALGSREPPSCLGPWRQAPALGRAQPTSPAASRATLRQRGGCFHNWDVCAFQPTSAPLAPGAP